MTQARVMDDVVVVSQSLTQVPAPVGEQAIEQVEVAVARRIGQARWDLWFDRKSRLQIEGATLRLTVANTFAANWIRTKLLDDVRHAASEVLRRPMQVAVDVDPALQTGADEPPVSRETAVPAAAPRVPAMLLNSRHLLEEFVVGPSNQLAYHAAMRVAEAPGEQFNPLFIHGHCGMGKTHLLQGICQRIARLHPGQKWLYLTGEAFTNEFLEAIRQHRTDAFRKRIRNADVLVIDDVHFLANKKATQEEFLHTLNQIDAAGKQLVLASDCAPRAIASMTESLISRFVSGMVVRMDPPDLPTRLEILRRRVARNQWHLSDAVLMHIAQSAAGSVRELEGLLVQAVAGMTLLSSPATDASAVLASIRSRTAFSAPVSMARIVAVVAQHFSVTEAAMRGSTREKLVANARAVAMYLARQHTGMSYPEIGRAMGNKNHSTVIAACQRVENLIAAGAIICWTSRTDQAAHHQAMTDIVHDLEAQLRRKA